VCFVLIADGRIHTILFMQPPEINVTVSLKCMIHRIPIRDLPPKRPWVFSQRVQRQPIDHDSEDLISGEVSPTLSREVGRVETYIEKKPPAGEDEEGRRGEALD
jgi:hypothetical protein